MDASSFQGFKVIELMNTSGMTKNPGKHQLFIKQHSVRDSDSTKPPNLTLFIINLPPYVTQDNLKRMFEKFGKVNEVFLHKEPKAKSPSEQNFFHQQNSNNTFKVGYVVFTTQKTMKRILSLDNTNVLTLSTEDEPLNTGLTKWYKEYNESFIKLSLIKEVSQKIILEYDLNKQREKDASSNEPDKDGWVTVNYLSKRKRPLKDDGKQKRNKRKKKKNQLLNFYAFQNKEAKLEHLAEHRKKYEEDRKRLEIMKTARKFKPL